jgi:hypothetical protein
MSRGQKGQAVILLAVMIGTLCLVLALAIDTGIAYIEAAAAQRAAAAAALAGVVYMPYQFDRAHAFPPGSNNDAVDRALLEAKHNGFDVADTANGISVTVSAVPGHSNELQVTARRNVPFGFGGFLQNGAYNVTRTAIAAYLPPITLGEPGNQLGSTVSQLGGTGFYFLRTEAWASDRQEGDALTPNPGFEYGRSLSPPSTDVHRISAAAGTDPPDATLPQRGGENFRVVMPVGGTIQVYNSAFAPETAPNYCENARPGSPSYKCSPGAAYFMHETDSLGAFTPNSKFAAMRYTLYSVANLFIRSADTKLTQMTVFPIAVTAPGVYRDINTGATVTQAYDASGSPSNMRIYHSWIDPANYAEPGTPDLVTYDPSHGPLGRSLAPGTYRLRVDTLEANGAIPNGSGSAVAHKGYAVRVLDASGQPCPSCTIGAWNDMTTYTPVTGGTYAVPLFNVPPDYAGKTISVGIYDPGDISLGGFVNLAILDPLGAVATAPPPQTIAIYDLGVQRLNPLRSSPCITGSPTVNPPCLIQSTNTAALAATAGGVNFYNGHWVDIELPIPANYNPGADPNGWWWSLQYTTPTGTTANDTITVAVGYGGTPSHLIG